MESARFDALSRRLAGTTTRRTTLAGLAGLAGMLARLLGGAAETAARPEVCRPLGGACFPDEGLPCCGGECRRGRCRCTTGKKRCRRRCIRTQRRCRKRRGRRDCPAGTTRCQGRCIRRTACCGGCGPGQICDGGRCGPRRCRDGGPCRVFLTSEVYKGDLREGGQGSGIAGADAKCQALADASPRTEGGIYKAWLSDSTPDSGPATRFTHTAGTGPYVLVDDRATVIATDWADLTDGSLLAPILVTELGQEPELPWNTWTYTLPDGTPGGSGLLHCQDWTLAAFGEPGDDGAPGDAASTDSQWTRWGNRRFCDFSLHLYCFEQG